VSEFVAGAFVDVRPDAKGFRAALKKDVDNAIKNSATFKVPIELDPKRFKSTVAAAARQTTAKVPIVPSTSVAELRKQIKDKIDKATKGMKIKVPIEVEAAGRGSRGGRGGAAGSASAKTQGAASNAAAGSTTRLTKAQQRQQVVNAALQKSKDRLAIADKALTAAQVQGISAEERAKRLREAHTATTGARKAATDLLATSEQNLTKTQIKALEAASKRATVARETVAGTQKEAAANKALLETTTKSRKARVENIDTIRKEVSSFKNLADLNKHNNDLSNIDSRLKAQSNRARAQGAHATVQFNEGLREEIRLKKEAIKTQRDELKGEGLRARQQKTAFRGAGATALSLLGVRGATLAANSAFLIGAASAALFAKSIKSFADLETELHVFQATAGATAEQMREVAKAASALGRDVSLPGVTASDAAQAMSELARAGLSVRDSIAASRGVLELAAAAQISNGEAATLTASALNAFNLEGEEAAKVVDLLANAANASQGSISEFGAAMQQALAISKLVGFSLQDTVAQLTIFAQNGLRGSDAGTSLRTALSRLIAPTAKAGKLIDALGLSLRDAQGNLRNDIFVQFGEATENLTPALRDMIAQTIAGQDAIRAFAIGADEGRRGLERAQLQMEVTGSAAQLAGARAKGLGGEFRALGSQAETLGTTLGKFSSGPVGAVVGGLNDIFTALNQIATGDFSGLFDDAEDDFDQFVANAKQRGKALARILNPLEQDRPFRGLFDSAPDVNQEDKRIETIKRALSDLQNLRLQTFDVGGNIGPITEEIKRLRKELQAAKVDAGLIIPVTKLEKSLFPLREARKGAADLRKEILETGGAPGEVKFLDDLIRNFDVRIKLVVKSARDAARDAKNAMKKEMSAKDIAASFTQTFALIAREPDLATPEILGSLRTLITKIEGTAPLTGAAGKKVGKALMDNLNAAIKSALAEDNTELAAELQAFANKIANLFGLSMANAFKGLKLPLTEEQIIDSLLPARIQTARAEAFGTVEEQIAGKEKELAGLKRGLNKVIKGSEDEEKILNAIKSKRDEIRSLREGQASDEKEANQKADKKFEDSQSAAEQKLRNDLSIAQQTEGLKNDIRAQTALRDFYRKQIQTIKATVRDADARNEAVKEAEQNLFEAEQDLAETRADRRAQIREASLKGLDEAAERAEETETLKDDVRQGQRKVNFWRAQVRVIKQLVKDRKATADELSEAQDELDAAEDDLRNKKRDRRDQRREERRGGLELDIQFAQITENRNAELRARERFIRFLEEQKRLVRGNINKVKELRNEIAEQKKAIAELNGEAKDDQATSAFELLQQNAETFKRTAGDLISGNQPFAGAAGFTGDIAQFLFRNQPTPPPAQPLPSSKTSGALDRNDRAHFSRLTNSIDNLANVIERQPGAGKSGAARPKSALERNDRAHFEIATQSRQVIERRSGI
jgi:TP901 family phage tail tape measure protein